jgi:hypothetical protein
MFQDEVMWKNNGGMFPKYSRYNSQKWKDMMGPDDPSVRGRRASRSSMLRARSDFKNQYLEPVIFALELVERIRSAVIEATEKNGPSKDGDYENDVGIEAWEAIACEPSVREKLAELAKNWCDVDASSIEP